MCDSHKASELFGADSTLSFGEIGRNRHCSAPSLRNQPEPFVTWPRSSETVDQFGQDHRLLPYDEVTVAPRSCRTRSGRHLLDFSTPRLLDCVTPSAHPPAGPW